MISLEHIRVGRPKLSYRVAITERTATQPLLLFLMKRMAENLISPAMLEKRSGFDRTGVLRMRKGQMPTGNFLIAVGEALDLELVWREKPIPFIQHKRMS